MNVRCMSQSSKFFCTYTLHLTPYVNNFLKEFLKHFIKYFTSTPCTQHPNTLQLTSPIFFWEILKNILWNIPYPHTHPYTPTFYTPIGKVTLLQLWTILKFDECNIQLWRPNRNDPNVTACIEVSRLQVSRNVTLKRLAFWIYVVEKCLDWVNCVTFAVTTWPFWVANSKEVGLPENFVVKIHEEFFFPYKFSTWRRAKKTC